MRHDWRFFVRSWGSRDWLWGTRDLSEVPGSRELTLVPKTNFFAQWNEKKYWNIWSIDVSPASKEGWSTTFFHEYLSKYFLISKLYLILKNIFFVQVVPSLPQSDAILWCRLHHPRWSSNHAPPLTTPRQITLLRQSWHNHWGAWY